MASELRHVSSSGRLGVRDMHDLTHLSNLTETTLLNSLKQRYDKDIIYTYVGDILVAINPFKQLPIYTKDWQQRYNNTLKTENPPHTFAIADAAYWSAKLKRQHQCCVISGESGAGKTESAKHVIKHIIHLCHSGSTGENLERQILQVNPLLEAFGNACTIMNDNSSRFGKYTVLLFNEHGHVRGATISQYLLEKSRVVYQQPGERNFHILGYLFHSRRASTLGLTQFRDFTYMATCPELEDNPARAYQEVVDAMRDVGFTDEDINNLHNLLAGILHIGNVSFRSQDEHDPVSIAKEAAGSLKRVSELLGVSSDSLQSALTESVTITRGESIRRQFNQLQAVDARDALAKALYGRMFSWIVYRINEQLKPTDQKVARMGRTAFMPATTPFTMIGILDIFGFEHFDVNSFEQFCINLANEQLQRFFNEHIFAQELAEYKKEGVDTVDITYRDNQPILDLFLRPMGLMSLLDEESMFPQASDASLVDKIVKHHGKHPNLRKAVDDSATFTVVHFAGSVCYDAEGFLDKNRDNLAPGIVVLLQESTVSMVSQAFLGSISPTGQFVPPKQEDASMARRRPKEKTESKSQTKTNKRSLTVGAQFKNSLQQLVDDMTACNPHFIRCVKPNTEKAANNFDDDFVIVQLNYTGMLETTRIRREGYSYRPKYEDFFKRFSILCFPPSARVEPDAASCRRIVEAAGISDFHTGRTRIFLKHFHVDVLYGKLRAYRHQAVVLQKVCRGFRARQNVRRMLAEAERIKSRAAELIEALVRGGDRTHQRLMNLAQKDEQLHVEAKSKAKQRCEAEAREKARQDEDARQREVRKKEELQRQAEADERKQRELEDRAQRLEKEEEERRLRFEQETQERWRQFDEETAERRKMLDIQEEELKVRRQQLDSEISRIENEREEREKELLSRLDEITEVTKHLGAAWYQQNERAKGAGQSETGNFHDWFHGIISRHQAELLLTDMPIGCYLVRISSTRLGYVLTFRVDDRCKHYVIDQDKDGQYMLLGVDKPFASLNGLITYFTKNPINSEGDLLTIACSQRHRQQAREKTTMK